MPFTMSMQSETHTLTLVAESISYDDNHYTKDTHIYERERERFEGSSPDKSQDFKYQPNSFFFKEH